MYLLPLCAPLLMLPLASSTAEESQQDVGSCSAGECRIDGSGSGGGQQVERSLGPEVLRSLQESSFVDMNFLKLALEDVDLERALKMGSGVQETVEGLLNDDPQAQQRLQDLAKAYGADDFWDIGKGMCGNCVSNADRSAIFAANAEAEHERKSHIYGEVDPKGMTYLLKRLGTKPGFVYYDLGSGSGKTSAIASFVFGMRSVGIELSADRHRRACAAQVELQHLQNGVGGSLFFVKGSFFDFNISDADIVYMNNLEFSADMMDRLGEAVQTTKPGTNILSMKGGPKLPAWITSATHFKHLGVVETTASWGSASLHIHKKLTEPPVSNQVLPPPETSPDACGTSPHSGAGQHA